ncbi:MAG: hypothetical protein COA66_15390 [Arcobacter sp.]|nr:MAG: hypothetical protein COA66_15390 [Arcobacter sp.]
MKKDKIIDLIFQDNEQISTDNKLNITEELGSSKIDMLKIIKKTSKMEIYSHLSFEELLKNDNEPDMKIFNNLKNTDISSLKNSTLEKTVIPHSNSKKRQVNDDNNFKTYTNRDINLYVEDTIVMKDLQKTQ